MEYLSVHEIHQSWKNPLEKSQWNQILKFQNIKMKNCFVFFAFSLWVYLREYTMHFFYLLLSSGQLPYSLIFGPWAYDKINQVNDETLNSENQMIRTGDSEITSAFTLTTPNVLTVWTRADSVSEVWKLHDISLYPKRIPVVLFIRETNPCCKSYHDF